MSYVKPTRRAFVATGAAAVALGMAGCAPKREPIDPNSDSLEIEPFDQDSLVTVTKTPSICDGCPNQCALTGFSARGSYWKVLGKPEHVGGKGLICARGFGYPQTAFSPDRIKTPLVKRSGKLVESTWDEALQLIGDKVKEALSKQGPDSIVLFEDIKSSYQPFGLRFLHALGSPQRFTDACNDSLGFANGYKAVVGATPRPDWTNARFAVLLGRSCEDTARPSNSWMQAHATHENGLEIVMVDARQNDSGSLSRWVSIAPGTDLAFVLGIMGTLVREHWYNKDFVAKYGAGFDEFANHVVRFTPDWAAEICGCSRQEVYELAQELAKHAPASFIDVSWHGPYGSAYQNSTHTGRAVALVNALLGAYQAKGGLLFVDAPQSKPQNAKVTQVPWPFTPKHDSHLSMPDPWNGSALAALEATEAGKIAVAFFHRTNTVRDIGPMDEVRSRLEKVPFKVALDSEPHETCEIADVVLPLDTYAEHRDGVEFYAGGSGDATGGVALRNPFIDRQVEQARSPFEAFAALAKACGVVEHFNFSIDEYNAEQLAGTGVSYDTLVDAGLIWGLTPELTFNDLKLKTASGKIDFTSDLCDKAGLGKLPTYVEPLFMPANEDEFRLIGGEAYNQAGTRMVNNTYLMDISRHYKLDRLWINDKVAQRYGLSEDDQVELSMHLPKEDGSFDHEPQVVRVYPTPCIHPQAVYLPNHFGSQAEGLSVAKGFGVNRLSFVPYHVDPISGTSMSFETMVTIKKVGA